MRTRVMPQVAQRVPRTWMGAALAVSWVSMLAHNLYELPVSALAPENVGPLAVTAAIGLAYAIRPGSPAILVTALMWGVLNLVVGGVVTVLPLPILPFTPEQSLPHYLAHTVYTVGQVPLVVLAGLAVRTAPVR